MLIFYILFYIDGTIANRLQYVYKPVLSKDTCRIVNGFDPSTMICGGFLEGGKDSCQVFEFIRDKKEFHSFCVDNMTSPSTRS